MELIDDDNNTTNAFNNHHDYDDDEKRYYEHDPKKQQHFHVLAVDDSLIDRKFLERLLTVSSYQVTCVDSGDKALEYLGIEDNIEYEESSSSKQSDQQEVSKINMVMTDYSMPGITGYDLLKRIKDSCWKNIPVVVMSSENVPSRISMCLEGGAEEFLLKPVKPSDLEKLHSHLLKQRNHPINNNGDHDGDDDDDDDGSNNHIREDNSDIAITVNQEIVVRNKEGKESDLTCCTTLSSDVSDRSGRVQVLPVSKIITQ